MATNAASGHFLIGLGKAMFGWAVAITVAAFVVWGIVFLEMRQHDGIYGGFSLGDAQTVGRDAMIVKYGKTLTSKLKYAEPAAVKKHLTSVLAGGTQHVWELHMVGPRGVRYCVTVWHPSTAWSTPSKKPGENGTGIDIGGQTLIRKGCSFR